MRKTLFAGLTVLSPDESVTTDNGAFIGRDRDIMDRLLELGAKTHRHTGLDGLQNPPSLMGASAIASAGTISADESFSLAYTLEDADGGETILSPIVTFSTPSPISPPFAAPNGEAVYEEGGDLPVDTYYYAFSFIDGGGGETPIGPARAIERQPGWTEAKVLLSGLEAPVAAASAAGWRLYRAVGGGDFGYLASGTTDSFVDDGSLNADCDLPPLPTNVNTTNGDNSFQIALPSADVFVAEGTFINVYMTNSGTFVGDALLEQFPLSSAGEKLIYTSVELLEGQPPDVNNSLGGAHKIDPDTELIDWHWKRPVKTVEDLPEEGNEEGDVRAILEVEEPTVYIFLNGEWQPFEFGGGAGGSIAVAAIDQDYIYWVDTSKGSIGRSKHDGTEVTHNFITTPDEPIWGVVVDHEFIYWIDGSGNHTIGRARLDGSEGTNDFITLGVAAISGIAVNDTHIYWANFQSETIGRANLDGSGVNNEFLTTPENPSGLAIDDTFVYWTDGETTSIGRAKLDGSEPNQNWLTTPTDPIGVTVNEDFIFWLNESGDSIGRAKIDGTEPNNSFMTGPAGDPIGIWADEEFIYWTDWENDTVGRAKVDGTGATNTLVTGLSEPGGLTVGHSVVVDPTERLEFIGSGITRVEVEDRGSAIARVTIETPGLDVIASAVTVQDALQLEFVGSGGVKVTETEPTADKALVNVEGPAALLANEGMGVIVHGSNAAKARGTSFKQYTWIGSVEPENMAEFDIWIETP